MIAGNIIQDLREILYNYIKDSKIFQLRIIAYSLPVDIQTQNVGSKVVINLIQKNSQSIVEQLTHISTKTVLIIDALILQKNQLLIKQCKNIRAVVPINLKQNNFQTNLGQQKRLLNLNENDCFSLINGGEAFNFLTQQKQRQFIRQIRNILQNEQIESKHLLMQYLQCISSQYQLQLLYQQIPEYFCSKFVLFAYSLRHEYYSVNIILRRTQKASVLRYLHFIIKGLHTIISSFDVKQIDFDYNKFSKCFQCFRGCQISQRQVEYLKQQHNQVIITCRYFMSTSASLRTAQQFRRNCMIFIQVPIKKGYMFLEQNNSMYFEESQILFDVLSQFQLLQIKEEKARFKQGQKSWKIKLKYIGNLLYNQQK